MWKTETIWGTIKFICISQVARSHSFSGILELSRLWPLIIRKRKTKSPEWGPLISASRVQTGRGDAAATPQKRKGGSSGGWVPTKGKRKWEKKKEGKDEKGEKKEKRGGNRILKKAYILPGSYAEMTYPQSQRFRQDSCLSLSQRRDGRWTWEGRDKAYTLCNSSFTPLIEKRMAFVSLTHRLTYFWIRRASVQLPAANGAPVATVARIMRLGQGDSITV